MITVLVVDDQHLVRTGFRTVLDLEDDITVVGEADNGLTAVERTRLLRPDVVLMDIRMPGMNGLEATRRITGDAALSETKVLILTTFELDEYVYEALSAGASGFLVKHASADALVAAIHTVAQGDALLTPKLVQRLITRFGPANGPASASRPATRSLTEREREAVALVAQGLSNEDIARRWFVSNGTVRTHVSRAMTKLHARDRAQLVVIAYRAGLADPDFLGET